jgi:hypothetical protein
MIEFRTTNAEQSDNTHAALANIFEFPLYLLNMCSKCEEQVHPIFIVLKRILRLSF